MIPVIVGPTAVGKTSLSILLAKKLGYKILSLDSMQIYKDMNILNAKIKEEEKENIYHYGIDIISIEKEFSLADYLKYANDIIEKEKGKLVIVGGTGLYLNGLVGNINFEDEKIDNDELQKYRAKLEQRCLKEGIEKLYEEAIKIDSESMKKISINDKKRIFRILEIYHFLGCSKKELEKRREKSRKNNFAIFMLNEKREKLYQKINDRVIQMIEEGLLQEVETIYDEEKDKISSTAKQAIGYKEVVEYIENKVTYDEMVENIQKASRHYAKRQITWFKKNNPIYLNVYDLTKEEMLNIIMEKIRE